MGQPFIRGNKHERLQVGQTVDGAALLQLYIGSVTKSFTALAMLQLVEAGKVALDAPVQRYLPWFGLADAAASRQMTVRHLLYERWRPWRPAQRGKRTITDNDLPIRAESHPCSRP